MSRWAALSANELSVLEGTFWLHGPSRDALSQRLAFSRTHVNAPIAGLLEQGWLALTTRHLEVGYTPLGDQAGLIGAGVLALQELLRGRGRVAAP